MSLVYDLHTHTTASDGELLPEALIIKAKANGIDVIAITDHDTTAGIPRAAAEADKQNIKLLVGIELSVSWMDKNFHIVGLDIDADNPALKTSLKNTKDLREQRAVEIGKRLDKYGVSDAYHEAKELAGVHTLTRSHFARVLINQGFAKDSKEVFKKYLVHSKPGFVKTQWIEMEMGLKLIKQSGGVAILAHPLRYNITASWLRKFLTAFKAAGGESIEVVTGSSNADEIRTTATYAKRFELTGSAGSDFHGFDNTWVKLGQLATMPESVTPVWKGWAD
jgi:predicted metal-dependent phosphoesterase TrpH